jgi:hypothetical protein
MEIRGMDGHPDHTEIDVEWLDSNRVRVSYTPGYGDRIRHKCQSVGNIRIEFIEDPIGSDRQVDEKSG